ncbi:MAG TPA: hypothetical protein VEL74_04725 [Thermoanaerobaculia bacterium]|nr:hypothetical protein [Thermoanaerobaculia bacterium]
MSAMKTFLIASVAIFSAAVLAMPAHAGQVAIFPKRVVFSGGLRTAEVTLANQGKRPVTYRIELIEQRMTPAGMLETVTAPSGPRSPIDLVRYSPRQISVAPGAPQTVRLLLRTPADLPPGEYRVHLLCRALPDESELADVAALAENEGLAVKLIPIPAVSIPILIRHGDGLRASVRLSGLAFDPEARSLSFRLEREGGLSVYGDLTATLLPADGGPEQVIAQARGLAVYTELGALEQRLALAAGLPKGRLRLRFTSRPQDDGGGPAVSAEAETEIP